MSSAYAQIPLNTTTIDAPVLNAEQASLETTRVLFFAGDTITDLEKRELSFKEFGGIFLPHIQTLRDTNHMLYRCQLTQLPPFTMFGEWDTMLPPEERKHWQKSFTRTVIDPVTKQQKQVVIDGFLGSNLRHIKETGEFKQQRDNTVIFNKKYPLHDAREATRRTGQHTVGGVVEIAALLGATADEITEAQYFFFPEWDEIRRGSALLPSTSKDLEMHLSHRIGAIADLPWDGDKKQKFYSIGNDMVRSVKEFTRTAIEAIRSDEIMTKQAFTKGHDSAINSVISDKYLEQTGTYRKEDAVTNQASEVSALAGEMRAERTSKAETEAKMLLLEERKQYTAEIAAGLRERDVDEEIRLGMRKPKFAEPATAGLVAIEPPIDVEMTVSTNVCGKPTAQGSCGRTPKDGHEYCWQHDGD